MLNIKKIVKLVKKGSFYCNAFSKEAQERSLTELDPEMQSDEAAQWLQQQQQPVPSEIPVQMQPPQLVQTIPEEVEQAMDRWVKENNMEIEFEGSQELAYLTNKKDKAPSESALGPDFALYKELIQHSEYKDVLSNKIIQFHPNVGKDKSDLFVDTMMSKTMGILGDIEQRERGMEQEQTQREEQTQLAGSEIAAKLYEKFLSLTPEEKRNVKDIMRMNYNLPMLSFAIKKNFEEPDPGRIDQRINFFLYNSQFLEPVFQEDPEFASNYSHLSTRNQKVDALKDQKGQRLLDILNSLVDSFDPSIIQWVKKGFPYRGMGGGEPENIMEVSQSQLGAEEDDEGRTSTLEGLVSTDWADLSITGADKEDTLEFISKAVQYYLEDNINELNLINDMSSKMIMEEAKDELMGILEQGEKISQSEKQKLLSKYAFGEKMNAYFLGVYNQIKSLLYTRGGLGKDISKIIYKNPDGYMQISSDDMKKMLDIAKHSQEDFRGREMDISDYKSYIDGYRDRIRRKEEKDPWKPEWQKMMVTRSVMGYIGELGEIKRNIFDLKKRKVTDPLDAINKLSGSRNEFLLNKFSGVSKGDTEQVKNKKIYDFVYMTLLQDEKQQYMNLPLYSYESVLNSDKLSSEIEFLKEKLKGQYNQSILEEIENKRRKLVSERHKLSKNFKASLGTIYIPLLSYIANAKDKQTIDPETDKPVQMFLPGSLFGFVELFDTHSTKIKNFLEVGQKQNPYDDRKRTNTELYYKAKGEDPPDHVSALYNLYFDGINEYESKTGKRQKTLEPGSWYDKLFEKYHNFDVYQRAYEKQKNKADSIQSTIDKRIFKANNKVKDIITRDDGGVALQKIKNNIEDPEKQIEFSNVIDAWNGINALPKEYYTYFGQKLTEKKLTEEEEALRRITEGFESRREGRKGEGEGLNDLKLKFEQEKENLRKMLQQRGLNVDLSALRIASVAYNLIKNRLTKLSEIKKSGKKFASTVNIDSIMYHIRKDFDDFFLKLFS